MVLIIAEKPSLARNIAAGIGTLERKKGYLEGNGYIVTWAFGHLFSLCDVEDYNGTPRGTKWDISSIPCFPDTFKFRLQDDSGVSAQFEIIKTLCNRADVEKIVNAGDADREGEIIIRLCIQNALETDKPQYRLWLPDQTPETVAQALNTMKSADCYNNLANEGFARTYVDWLYGINLTRFATLKTGMLLRVGRVIVPIVKAVYDRDMSIKNFVPEKYYGIRSKAQTNGQEIELLSKKKFDKTKLEKANELCKLYNSTPAVVSDKKKKLETLNAGKLFSLSKLQNLLGKKYKMPMEKSLQIVQKLYESGFVTYPRTNTEYLATAEKDKIKKILENIQNLGYPVTFKDKKTIFDDSKIESHSALTPTYKIPPKNALSDDELLVYRTVFLRFVAVFCKEECKAEKTEITIKLRDYETFTLKGIVIVNQGFTKYDTGEKKNKILPPLEKGDTVNVNFEPVEKETSPPKHYTIETLNNYLKNPFREDKAKAEDEDDTEEYRAMFEGLELGTEATRTGIIDNARKSGYIELKKDVYKILPAGEYFINALERMNISMDKYKTSKLSQALKKVYKNEYSVNTAVDIAKQEINEVFETKPCDIEHDTFDGFYKDYVGVCPLCKRDVIKGRYGYGCVGYKDGCKFKINSYICKRVISIANAKKLLSEGKTSKIAGFVSKNGKQFDAYLTLDSNGNISFEF